MVPSVTILNWKSHSSSTIRRERERERLKRRTKYLRINLGITTVYKDFLEIIIKLLKDIKALSTWRDILCSEVGAINIRNDVSSFIRQP